MTLAEVEGVTPAMLVALGEAGIKTVEDLAGCATDDLIGWTERKQGETVKHKGAFSRSRRVGRGSRGASSWRRASRPAGSRS